MLGELANSTILLSLSVFVAAVSLFAFGYFILSPLAEARLHVRERLLAEGIPNRRSLRAQAEVVRIKSQRPVEAYFDAAEKEQKEAGALEGKLFRAGFHQKSAATVYTLSRVAFVAVGFFATFALLSAVLPSQLPRFLTFGGAALIGLGCMVIPSVALDMFESARKQEFRRGFPDFMDMMITCADAGMSLEGAVARVSEEIAGTHKTLGIQLAIMTLQMRAGKPLRDALHDLADRVGIDEARSLAVLFRQSEELGTSLTDALRVYSDEMRTQRILLAEEKANVLPVKMMVPLGLCVFPVVLMIIMLPVVVRMKGIFF